LLRFTYSTQYIKTTVKVIRASYTTRTHDS